MLPDISKVELHKLNKHELYLLQSILKRILYQPEGKPIPPKRISSLIPIPPRRSSSLLTPTLPEKSSSLIKQKTCVI